MCLGLLLLGAVPASVVWAQAESRAATAAPKPNRLHAKAALQGLGLARNGFTTKLVRRESAQTPVPTPPAKLFRRVSYHAPLGDNAAYLTPDPKDGAKHPAIVWITGGDYSTIGDVWKAAPATNDQTASAYREAGIVMMFPSLRGGNQNPGVHEGFLGEVDDVIAARDFLVDQPYVDPERIYLGGHSTGGTLALLVAETTNRFRAVFCFGPVGSPVAYGDDFVFFDATNPQELKLRSPALWLDEVRQPTFVIEGAGQGNRESVERMAASSRNSLVHFLIVPDTTHFSVLRPANAVIAAKLMADTGPIQRLRLSVEEIQRGAGH